MSQDELFQAEPVKPGMSGASKVLIGLGIACGVVVLLCCGGGIAFMFWAQNFVENALSDDPVIIAQTTDEITDVEIPEQFVPSGAIDIELPFVDGFMSMSDYTEGAEEGFLVVAQFSDAWADNSTADEMLREIRNVRVSQGKKAENVTVEESEEIELSIRGEPATFSIERGTGDQSGEEVWRVSGTFRGKQGVAFLLLQAKTDNMTRDEIDEMLESLE